jgi:hypothetical protein
MLEVHDIVTGDDATMEQHPPKVFATESTNQCDDGL